MRQLSGHAPRDESEKYGEAYLPTLAINAAKLKFDMVEWAPIIAAWLTIDWDDVVASLLLRYPENAQMAA